MASLPGGAASTLLPSPKIQALPSASSKKSTTKCKSLLSQKIALPNNMPPADFHNYNQLPMMSLSGSAALTPLPTPKIQALLSASSKNQLQNANWQTPQKRKYRKLLERVKSDQSKIETTTKYVASVTYAMIPLEIKLF